MILEPKKIVCHCFHCFPIYLPWSDGTWCHDLHFWILSFKPALSLFSFTLIKRLFSSSLISVIRVVSSAYVSLLIFLPAILVPGCDSSSLAFPMMYSAYKLNKQGDNTQPCCTPFPILNQFVVPCNLHAYKFSGKVVWYSHLFKNSLVCCDPHSQRLSHSQWSRNRHFSGILLLSLWSNEYWQFDLWFLCLF